MEWKAIWKGYNPTRSLGDEKRSGTKLHQTNLNHKNLKNLDATGCFARCFCRKFTRNKKENFPTTGKKFTNTWNMIFLVGWLKQPLEKFKSLYTVSQIGSFPQRFKTPTNQQPQIYESTTFVEIQVGTGRPTHRCQVIQSRALIGGHQQPLKSHVFHNPPKKVTAWITRCKGFVSIFDHQKQSQKPPCWVDKQIKPKL